MSRTALGVRPYRGPLPPAVVLGRPGWRLLGLGGVRRSRYLAVTAVAVLLLVAGLILALGSGYLDVTASQLWRGLNGQASHAEQLVAGARLWRGVAAAAVGFCLGAAGAITQSITRNPLASPDILGVSAGAGLFAVVALVAPVGAIAGRAAVPASAVLGALVTVALIVGLSWRKGLKPVRLLLMGVGISAVATTLTQGLLLLADLNDAAVAMRWLAGSVAGTGVAEVRLLAPLILATVLLAWPAARWLAALRLGPEVARSLGVRVGSTQVLLVFAAVVLVAVTTAVAGPIGFVAFVAPQVALRVFGTAGPPLLGGALVGALLVLASDLMARSLPVQLPVGVITSMVGGPALLILLLRRGR